MSRTLQPKNIVLGMGVFAIDGTDIGLTRDGGNFSVEYESREIHADGDKGPVKGRVVIDGARAKLSISHLEILTAFAKMHAGINVEVTEPTVSGDPTITKITGKDFDDTNDYHTVTFTGETKAGKEIKIEIKNAFNVENINFALKEKDEILDAVVFQAAYDEGDDDQNWSITYKE